MTSTSDELLERLDLILGVLQLAHHDAITRAAEGLRTDDVNAAILDVCAEWMRSAEVYAAVKASTKASERTIRSRLLLLQTRRALQARGTTHTREFRAAGLV